MGVYHIPVVLIVRAESFEEAANNVEEWGDDVDVEDLPEGTEEIDALPNCELNDEGQRLLYLPSVDGEDAAGFSDGEDIDGSGDDFNDGEDP